ncbi:hypothetical protein ACN9M1_02150 [Ralstonia sp. R-29]|uniref:hypothetical protein n=1 Tax=Ralstonia sp. R-29 TaxID=3404059 RepID=UPI003CF2C2AC
MRDSLPAHTRAMRGPDGHITVKSRDCAAGPLDSMSAIAHAPVSLIVDPFAPLSILRRGDLSFCHDRT